MAHGQKQWEIVRTHYELGLSLSDIVEGANVFIKSRGSISKRVKSEGWTSRIKKQQVECEVFVAQELDAAKAQKETLGAVERNIHNTLESEQLRMQTSFRRAGIFEVLPALSQHMRLGSV